MQIMNKKAIQTGASIAALSVILGAFGAHGLKKIVSDPALLASWDTAATYQMFHAIAIILVAILMGHFENKNLSRAITAFVVGVILFSGSIYTLVLIKGTQNIGLGPLGIITPIGGISFILGWIFVILALKKK